MRNKNMITAQETIDGEILVDNFAGGGGASTGIELALGKVVNIAINHDPAAILMHKTNHPFTEHYQASVWDIDPKEVCRGRPVALAWFSPDCKHFSKAKGAALVDKRIRGLAWITLRWAGTVRPRVIILENVEEFQTWGPVRKGKPVKKLAGTTFRKFISQLEGIGYTVEWRELVAADYGAPTTRKRFVLIARCDGGAIVWPTPTHAPRNSLEVEAGLRLPWRSAAEIIDWSLPCPSIFATKSEIFEKYGLKAVRPLADNTMRRAIRGVDKHTIKSGEPFLVPSGYGENKGQKPRVHDINEPLPTAVGKAKHAVCDPLLAPLTLSNTGGSVGGDAGSPVHTVRTGGGGQMLVTPSLMSIGQTGGGDRIRDLREPVPTAVSKQEACVVAPTLVQVNHAGGDRDGKASEPLPTVTAKHGYGVTAANLIQYHTEQTEAVRASSLHGPIQTIDASNRYGLTTAQLVEYYGNGNPLSVNDPMHTVTSHDREAVVAAHVVKFKRDELGTSPADPLPTQTASGVFALCKVHLCKIRPEENASLQHWPEIRELLNKYCGYRLSEDELLLLEIGGILYYIADIGLRMLSPRELYNAMGFPVDYIIEEDYQGNPYPKSEQVARCGNAVCPQMASAVVAANLPEYAASPKIETMEQLMEAVAV